MVAMLTNTQPKEVFNGATKNQRGLHMAEIESVVLKNVQLFLGKLRRAGFHISKAYIFGSYARGQVDKWSDRGGNCFSPNKQ